ncbi:Zinc finger protein 706, partial [Cynara cardunculus var. scolymus]
GSSLVICRILRFIVSLLLIVHRNPNRLQNQVVMTGKAKPKKHTAKEIAAKVDAATTNRGGGKAGVADRTGQEKGGHAKYECPHCKITAPDVKTMQIHHDAKHPKIPFDESKINNLHALLAPVADTSKPRPGVRGSLKK